MPFRLLPGVGPQVSIARLLGALGAHMALRLTEDKPEILKSNEICDSTVILN